uniref:Uncharacterized protein n=1 Tax=Oryza punctata TaxID=4537 RepID=A0A0E0MML2_ORYPU
MIDAFPTDRSSRIIVTTGVQSVASECSLGGFVYRLRGLNEKDSDELLWKLVQCERHVLPRDVQSYSGDIVRKCDGLPLALVGVAKYVRRNLGALKRGTLDCRDIARNLGMYHADGRYPAFVRAHMALKDCYEGLDSHGLNLKTCLLSVSMFPKKRGLRRKSLVRRWMAERLVHYDDKKNKPANIVALENFEELVDRIMIQGADDDNDENHPVLVGEPGTVKNKCSVHGVLLDFLLHESATKRFARLIRNGEGLDVTAINSNPVRRLAVVYDTDSAGDTNRDKLADMVNGLDLSRVRSLTVAGTVLSDSDLKCCKLLRVLDLDGCTGVTDGVLRSICKLKVLRYLSLRGTDARGLPPEMAELRFLETLDVRDIVMPGAEVQSDDVFTVTLPWDVLRLPYLKYLFGAFELPRDIPRRCSAPWTTAATASDAAGQLDTLAGFFIGNGRRELQCLETLLGLMKRLKKLKIWWKWNKKGVSVTAGPKDLPTAALTQLLVKFLKKRCFDLDSLSLDFGDQSLDFLNFPMDIHVPCKLRSIKLRGKLSSLPGIIIKEDNKIPSDHALTKLYLSFTGLSCEALLVLQRLPNLTYLKLVENSSGDFTDGILTLNAGGFPSLRGLHVQAPKLPEVKIVAGGEEEAVAMQHLTTLQLLCGDVSGFQAADIDRFHQLEQVVLLKSSLDESATKAWEAARKNHMNRPRIDTV